MGRDPRPWPTVAMLMEPKIGEKPRTGLLRAFRDARDSVCDSPAMRACRRECNGVLLAERVVAEWLIGKKIRGRLAAELLRLRTKQPQGHIRGAAWS